MKLFIRLQLTTKVLSYLFACLTLMVLGLQTAHAVTTETLNCTTNYQIVETMPNQAKWEMCWEPKAGYGYRLMQVIYTPPGGIRTKVLDNMHAAQLFVPYDDNGARYHDISYGVNLAVLASAECPGGRLLTNSTLCLVRQPANFAFKNLSTGLSVKNSSFSVFGYYGIGNYYYTFKYTFFDDGSIEPSVLASGSLQRYGTSQLTGWPIGSRIGISHHHLVIWRLDFDIDGTANNLVERVEFGGSGTDNRTMTVTPLATEIKETNNLNSARFWRVRNTVQNNNDGRSISYEIEPSVTDQLRAQESFTQNDFYLTQYRASEELVDSGLVGFVNGETVTDAVLWYGVNFHHIPRGEDDVRMPAHSQGFRIRPRDLTATAPTTNNNPPVIANPGNQSTATNTAVNLQILASDADGDTLSYSATGLPAGLSISSTTGVISGTTGPTATTSSVTVTVTDGRPGGASSASFNWSVIANNNPPVITNPGNQSTAVNTAVNLQILASDADGDALSYSAIGLPAGLSISSTTGVISGTTGSTAETSSVSVTATDGRPGGANSVSFMWNVTANGLGQERTFTAPSSITIRDRTTAQPYPVNINVTGMTGAVSKIALTLNGLRHTYPADIDVLLVGPAGQKVLLMSDAGGSFAKTNVSLTFETIATAALSQNSRIVTGTYRPTNYGTTDTFPTPAPARPYSSSLNVFNGTSPNGTWKLFIYDDATTDTGQILNGVTLKITTN